MRRVPGWFWLGWLVHLAAYPLPSYRIDDHDAASGFRCAWVVFGLWFGEHGLLRSLRQGQMDDLRIQAILGWFTVTNLAAILAPAVLAGFARPAAAWWIGLLCATGAAQAVAFGAGVITGQPEAMRWGFFMWLISYVWLAMGAFGLWRRRLRRAAAVPEPTAVVVSGSTGAER